MSELGGLCLCGLCLCGLGLAGQGEHVVVEFRETLSVGAIVWHPNIFNEREAGLTVRVDTHLETSKLLENDSKVL